MDVQLNTCVAPRRFVRITKKNKKKGQNSGKCDFVLKNFASLCQFCDEQYNLKVLVMNRNIDGLTDV